ncbi:MAG: TonB-dependent siderophore receptor [Leptolyngbyaceae cyanobacterium]
MASLIKEHRLTTKQRLGGLTLCLSGCLLMSSPASWASTEPNLKVPTVLISPPSDAATTPLLSNLEQPVNPVRAPIAQSQVVITGVRIEETAAGAQIVLEAGSELAAPSRQTVGNVLVVDIPNAVLALPEGGEFQQAGPAEGITFVSVAPSGDGVRVEITGIEAPPTAEVSATTESLTLSIATGLAEESDEGVLQLVVTGARDEGYNPAGASTATRTDTPLRDIPQSIQVVPRQVIEDQGITRIGDALRNVSGVTRQRDRGNASDRFTIRGFDQSRILRNGFRTGSTVGGTLATAPNTVERIEVLKGPASVLYGQVEPGGVVNFVTEQPSREPFYDLAFTVGSFGYIEPSLDFSGPLTADERLTYRLNTSYTNSDSFRDFVESDRIVVAPTLRYEFSDATSLTFEYVYLDSSQTYDEGLPIDPISFDLPRERTLSEPDDSYENTTHSFYLTLDHRFNDTIRLRSGFGAELSDINETAFRLGINSFNPETGENGRRTSDAEFTINNLSWQTDLMSEFNTGSIEHQLLAGFELARSNRSDSGDGFVVFEEAIAINVFDPQYGTAFPDPNAASTFETDERTLGLYLQDQVTLLPNLKLLVGGRYDFAEFEEDFEASFAGQSTVNSTESDTGAFSPRVGIVYQPIEPISLYASYSRSFIPNSATTADREVIEPERGTQYEVGVRGEFGDVSVNLAAYDITKTNIARTDLENPDFSIPIGEVRSRGIELDIAGEIVDGWNIIGSLFFNDAFISEGDDFNPEDDTLINAPDSGASLWTTYEIQTGDLQGLGFGAGLFYVGDREAEIPNDVVLPSYVRGDASIFYNRDNWQAQLSFQNLFNTDYFESTQNTGLIFPGAPFTVVGRISVRF